jgi:ABC-type arginine/histidine transport system permease subunit
LSPIAIVIHGSIAAAVLWSVSGTLALATAMVLARGLESQHRFAQAMAYGATFLSRSIPASLYVLAAGISSLRALSWIKVPNIFFGTVPIFQPVAFAVCLALAFSSSGHIAVIIQSSWRALPGATREQLAILDLGLFDRARLALSECAHSMLPPLSARLVHHLHNTAFAALFPVADLFGAIQGAADTSARVFLFVSLGAGAYACLSFAIWIALRAAESALVTPVRIRTGAR